MAQMPFYQSANRGTQAPPGFQPQQINQGPDPQRQTQRNNGGPIGMGQPARRLRMSAPSAPAPPPTPSSGPPPPGPGLYPPSMLQSAESQIWANRHSSDPQTTLELAFTQLLGRSPAPFELQPLMNMSIDDALMQIGQFAQQQTGERSGTNGLTPVQSAILGSEY